jgi:hypothetical protein
MQPAFKEERVNDLNHELNRLAPFGAPAVVRRRRGAPTVARPTVWHRS